MIRETYGATAMTRVRVGRISATQLFHGRDPGGIVLMAGRTWNTVVANRMTSTRATTNSGSAAMASSRFELAWSKTFSRVGADRDRQRYRQDRREHHQHAGVHQPGAQQRGHRLLGGQRDPEVAVQQA